MSCTKSCRLPPTPAVNATDLPSGEMAGDSSRPGRSVRRMTRVSGGDGSAGLPNLSRAAQSDDERCRESRATAPRVPRDHRRGAGTGAACGRRGHRVFELDPRVGDVVKPAPGIFLETTRQQAPDAGRRVGRERLSTLVRRRRRRRWCPSTVVAPNADEPVSISKSTHPKAQMSVRLSTG